MRRIGLIGLGAIGGAIAGLVARDAGATVVAALVSGSARARPADLPCSLDLEGLLLARPDVVIECAGQEALRAHGAGVLAAGIDLVPASIGLFADAAALEACLEAARRGGSRLLLPSGAVAGIDALLGARRLGVEVVRYRFVMSPSAWGHPVETAAPRPGRPDTETLVFGGTAREAARRFPRHANVTATIALAGIGFEDTHVELAVDTAATRNRHQVEARGHFGEMTLSVEGQRISETSPSSRLVAGSLLSVAIAGGPCIGGFEIASRA